MFFECPGARGEEVGAGYCVFGGHDGAAEWCGAAVSGESEVFGVEGEAEIDFGGRGADVEVVCYCVEGAGYGGVVGGGVVAAIHEVVGHYLEMC